MSFNKNRVANKLFAIPGFTLLTFHMKFGSCEWVRHDVERRHCCALQEKSILLDFVSYKLTSAVQAIHPFTGDVNPYLGESGE
jgi:hypothetical protein